MTTTPTRCSHRDAFAYGSLDADVVADLRQPGDPEIDIPAPCLLQVASLCSDLTRRVLLDGWELTPATHRGGPPGGSISVLTIEAEDGWRARIVFEQGSGSRFAYDGLRTAMPLLWQAMSRRGSGSRRLERAAVALPVLRTALSDPDSWFGPESASRDYSDTEWLVEWASCGVEHASLADALFERSVRVVPDPTRAGDSLVEWRESGIGDDAEIVGWSNIGTVNLRVALLAKGLGFYPGTYADWATTPLTSQERPTEICAGLRDAGWTAEAIRTLGAVCRDRRGSDPVTLAGLLSSWERVMPPRLAVGYLAAGIGVDEAASMSHSGTPPDDAALRMLGAFVESPVRPAFYLSPALIGDLSRYRVRLLTRRASGSER